MAEQDPQISKIEARITELEARPSAGDLDWLKNSNTFKRAEIATSPAFIRLNAIIVFGGIGLFFIVPILYLFVTNRFM
jgi:hypothetical protein